MEEMKTMIPKTCNGQTDEDLLCSAADRIDGAAYDLLCAVIAGEPDKDESEGAVRALVDASWDKEIPMSVFCLARMAAAAALFDAGLQKEVSDLDWDITIIGDVTDAIESELKLQNIPVCRPWQDDQEHICWSTPERCEWCSRGCQTDRQDM